MPSKLKEKRLPNRNTGSHFSDLDTIRESMLSLKLPIEGQKKRISLDLSKPKPTTKKRVVPPRGKQVDEERRVYIVPNPETNNLLPRKRKRPDTVIHDRSESEEETHNNTPCIISITFTTHEDKTRLEVEKDHSKSHRETWLQRELKGIISSTKQMLAKPANQLPAEDIVMKEPESPIPIEAPENKSPLEEVKV
jgi:hypothetical protein